MSLSGATSGHLCPLALPTAAQRGLRSHLFAVKGQSKHIWYIFTGRSQEAACPSAFIWHAKKQSQYLQRPHRTMADRGRSPADQVPARGRDSGKRWQVPIKTLKGFRKPTDVNPIWSFAAQRSPCSFAATGLFIRAPQVVADGLSKGPAELPACYVSMADVT